MSETDLRRGPGQREPVALYHQIFLGLRDEILSGALPFGAALPTEEELSAAHGVSRITARRALTELAEAGLVERRRRTGTRVIFKSPAPPVESGIHQALDALISFGHKTKVRVVEFGVAPASPRIAAALEIEPGENVVRAARLRMLDNAPLGHVMSYVPARLRRLVTRKALSEAPILEVLQRGGIAIGAARQTIAAVAADAQIAAMLEVEARAPLLLITRTVCDDAGAPILITDAHYRGDRYQVRLDLQSSAEIHVG
ncbi:MAG: GntR family transcriptional regulator [Hyphomonadaceae bacterium]